MTVVALTPRQEFSEMLLLIARVHKDQVDKQGEPYTRHLLKVAHWLRSDDHQLMAIALGHDVIEDHGKTVTYSLLRDMGFSGRVMQGIRCLTKVPGESLEEYKIKVKSNRDSVLVKMQDLRHNADLRRIKGVTQKDLDRTVKYVEFYHELKEYTKTWTE